MVQSLIFIGVGNLYGLGISITCISSQLRFMASVSIVIPRARFCFTLLSASLELLPSTLAVSRSLTSAATLPHAFIRDISIASFQVHYYSEALTTTALILCRS